MGGAGGRGLGADGEVWGGGFWVTGENGGGGVGLARMQITAKGPSLLQGDKGESAGSGVVGRSRWRWGAVESQKAEAIVALIVVGGGVWREWAQTGGGRGDDWAPPRDLGVNRGPGFWAGSTQAGVFHSLLGERW